MKWTKKVKELVEETALQFHSIAKKEGSYDPIKWQKQEEKKQVHNRRQVIKWRSKNY